MFDIIKPWNGVTAQYFWRPDHNYKQLYLLVLNSKNPVRSGVMQFNKVFFCVEFQDQRYYTIFSLQHPCKEYSKIKNRCLNIRRDTMYCIIQLLENRLPNKGVEIFGA